MKYVPSSGYYQENCKVKTAEGGAAAGEKSLRLLDLGASISCMYSSDNKVKIPQQGQCTQQDSEILKKK